MSFFSLNLMFLQRGHCLKLANLVYSDYVLVVSNTIYMPVTQKFVFSAKILPLCCRPLMKLPPHQILGLSRWHPHSECLRPATRSTPRPPASSSELAVLAEGGNLGDLCLPFPSTSHSFVCQVPLNLSPPVPCCHPHPPHIPNQSHGPS